MKEFLKNVFLAKRDLVGAPRGFSFEVGSKKDIIDKLYNILRSKGFEEVTTPVFDFFEVYEKTIGSSAKELFVFKDENDFIVPRYDITTQIVRFLAPRIKNMKLPIKVFYYGDVFREPEFEWYPRQIKQFGVELIGGRRDDFSILVSLLKEVMDVFVEFGIFKEYRFVFNFTYIIEKILEKISLDDVEIVKHLLSIKDLPSLSEILDFELYSIIDRLVCISMEYDIAEAFKSVVEVLGDLDKVDYYLQVISGVFGDAIFDPVLIPEMGYYSEIFFKVYVDNLPYPISGGGRYDILTQRFGYNQTAMGFAIDVL